MVKKEGQPSFLTQSVVLTKRSFVNMYRDLGYYWLRFAIYVALCLCVGTIYYDVGHSYGSIQVTKFVARLPGAPQCSILVPFNRILHCAVHCSAVLHLIIRGRVW